MDQPRKAAGLRYASLLLCLIGLTAAEIQVANGVEQIANLPEEQVGQPAPYEVGNSHDVPFEPVSGPDNAASPPAAVGDAPFELGGIQRLPPVDQKRAEPAGFGFGPGMGLGDRGPVSYRTFWFPSEPAKGQAADWGLVGQDFSVACPLWVDLPNTLMITAGVRNRLIDTDAILPDSHKPYPDELWDARVGLMYMRQLSGDRIIGGGVSVGSASDHPFASINEMNVSMNAMYRIPSGQRNA